jgi:hypothetical protein
VEWLALRATSILNVEARSGAGQSTADRAGQLLVVPQDGLEQEADRWLGLWWLWLATAVIVMVLAGGYVARRWRRKTGKLRRGWFTWRRPR